MADPEHLEILSRSVATWNRWRRQHRGVRPDLSADRPDEFAADVREVASAVLNEVMPGLARFPSPAPGNVCTLRQGPLSRRSHFTSAVPAPVVSLL
jgi:hypothetical protein